MISSFWPSYPTTNNCYCHRNIKRTFHFLQLLLSSHAFLSKYTVFLKDKILTLLIQIELLIFIQCTPNTMVRINLVPWLTFQKDAITQQHVSKMLIKMFSCFLLLTLFCGPCETFILDGQQCAAPAPCTCSGNNITCDSKSLTTIPKLSPFQASSSYLYLNFQYNQIVNITSNAFQNISTTNGTKIQLYLNNNVFSTLSDQAFNGIENATTYLYLASNKLSSLPNAISHLIHLEYLDVHNNPIVTLDGRVLAGIGHTLNILSISMSNMTTWPNGLHLLRHLQRLYIDHVPFRTIPTDAFNGFQNTLTSLSLTYTDLEQIPEGVCNLKHLTSIEFSNNHALRANISFDNLCHDALIHVTSVTLEGNQLYTFPSGLFTIFPQVTSIYLQNNKLRYIPFEAIPGHTQVTYLNLDNNLLTSIPFAVSKFQLLNTLLIRSNQIYSIEHNELVGLRHLAILALSWNPLEYIDSAAFRNQNTTLEDLYLSFTHLNAIPFAVTTLQRLRFFLFYNYPSIECSCDKMGHLRLWNVTRISIYDDCEFSNESIKDYLVNSLPQCPIK